MRGSAFLPRKSTLLSPVGLLLVIGLFSALALTARLPAGSAQTAVRVNGQYVEGELLVRFKEGVGRPEAEAVLSRHGMTIVGAYRQVPNLYHVRLESGMAVETAIALLGAEPAVQYAEPNYEVQFDSACPNPPSCEPDDPLYPSADNWGMANIRAPEAWTVTTGDSGVVVAVLDSGIDYNHPDLVDNIWTNPSETPGNNIDDDGDGYKDDIHGYNAVTDACSDDACLHPAGDPMDDDVDAHGHGTRLAGIIGAVGNNALGIAGVNWQVKLMAIKVRFEPNRQSSLALTLAGFDYLIAKRLVGVNIAVANMSFGVSSWSQALQDGIDAVRDAGILLVASAGNGGADFIGDNVDANPNEFHRSYDNVLFAAALNPSNQLTAFSNYGAIGIQLAAPGEGILSTVRTLYPSLYEIDDGTSYSAPFVTGVAALLASVNPGITYSELKARILSATTPKDQLIGKTSSGGRLNAAGVFSAPVTDLTPAGYELARIQGGSLFYLDRTYTISSLPEGFDGLWWVRTRNNDKNNAEESYIRLGLGQPATVYVAFDPAAQQVPNWLGTDQGWTQTSREVGVTVLGNASSLRLHTRPFSVGPVTLGGPLAAGYAGPPFPDNTNYVVLIRLSTGDADQEGASTNRLDGYDLMAFSLAMNSVPTDLNWCGPCDLDGNGLIEEVDRSLFIDNFGKGL
jgi:hypothetical protein